MKAASCRFVPALLGRSPCLTRRTRPAAVAAAVSQRCMVITSTHTRPYSSTTTTTTTTTTKTAATDLNIDECDLASFLKDHYEKPKHPIVLAHGLMGFDELHLAGKWFPGVQYWRGIREALEAKGITVITTTVPTTGSIEQRAAVLHEQIKAKLQDVVVVGSDSDSDNNSTSTSTIKDVNIIAHSMGGLDSRYLISRILGPPSSSTAFRVRSLTTIATPHRGSWVADMLLRDIGAANVASVYGLLGRLHVDTGAFGQLTCKYMQETFNAAVPDDPATRYFSYGAAATPHLFSVFRLSHALIDVVEGANDGLVSVRSSRWGEYKGTLNGVTHLDLINWTNRVKRLAASVGLVTPAFNAVAFYLAIADMLAREGF